MIEIGRQFGLYVIKKVITSNDTFSCCKAEDPFFNREVVLKVFSAKLFKTEQALARMEHQLERLAVLDHPSIAPIYDSGIEDEYIYYTTSNYCGGSLADQLTGALPAERALKLVAELTQALDYALEHELGQGKLLAEKIFFDAEGRAVFTDFSIDNSIKFLQAAGDETENGGEKTGIQGNIAETLRSLGELLLSLLLGSNAHSEERIEDQLAALSDQRLRKLLGRFLLPGEWRFSCFAELLEELGCFEEIESLVKGQSAKEQRLETIFAPPAETPDIAADEQAEQTIAEIRRLVAEKNGLQQTLNKAISGRNLAENKLLEEARELQEAREELSKVREEADVAWELVAGQKQERWRPAAWALGGFAIGFLLSGSYGYYYSEQTRNELLAKLRANEELIKSAAWRSQQQLAANPPAVASASQQPEIQEPVEPTTAEQASPEPAVAVEESGPAEGTEGAVAATEEPLEIQISAVEEKPQTWWPVGSEFSPAAAIPIEQIKVALGLESLTNAEDLPKMLSQEVLAVVTDWADSWSNQDLHHYFSYYSEDYRPELGRSQAEWREMRRLRVTRPQWIQLNLEDIRLRQVDADRIQVKLKQSYRSDFYQDQIFKSLNLVRENGQWRILMERSLGMASDVVGG